MKTIGKPTLRCTLCDRLLEWPQPIYKRIGRLLVAYVECQWCGWVQIITTPRKTKPFNHLILVLVLLLGMMLWTGCQTVHGLALDVESAARYTADHTKCDR